MNGNQGEAVLSDIKIGWRAWAVSLGALARSPVYVIILAAIAAFWTWAGYKWLWLTESSMWVLGLELVWLLALAALALAVFAGSVAAATAVASGADKHLKLRRILSFEKGRLGRTTLVVLIGVLAGIVLGEIFGWISTHALETASFLTFHSQHPVSYIVIAVIFQVLEALVWIAFGSFLLSWLLAISVRHEANAFAKPAGPGGRPPGLIVLLTGVLSAVAFGGLAYSLATWHPQVKAGGWDYAQLGIRSGAALLLLTLGWLFWTLALAHLTLAPVTDRSALPPHA